MGIWLVMIIFCLVRSSGREREGRRIALVGTHKCTTIKSPKFNSQVLVVETLGDPVEVGFWGCFNESNN